MKTKILKKIEDKSLKIGVIGLGYVGLPLAVECANASFSTIGFDIQKEKVDKVNNKINYIGDVVPDELNKVVSNKKLIATTDYSKLSEIDAIIICVPTPLDEYKQPDISYVENSAIEIAKYIKKSTLVILESTTYPTTTEKLLIPTIEKHSNLKCDSDFYAAFSPERIDPGNKEFKTKNTPKIVGGSSIEAGDLVTELYKNILVSDIINVGSCSVAEMAKIWENTYRHINIGLANEMAIICKLMGIDVWDVIEAAKTKPYGFQAFYPGPGLGGHCIPLDPYYLTWVARAYNYHTRLIETAGEINDSMPSYIVDRCSKMLNKVRKPIADSKVLICGMAYKADIDDYRESPSLKLFDIFNKLEAKVEAYDPYIDSVKINNVDYKVKTEISVNEISQYDLVVISTDHSNVDYEMIANNAQLIFDSRNAMKNFKNKTNIERL